MDEITLYLILTLIFSGTTTIFCSYCTIVRYNQYKKNSTPSSKYLVLLYFFITITSFVQFIDNIFYEESGNNWVGFSYNLRYGYAFSLLTGGLVLTILLFFGMDLFYSSGKTPKTINLLKYLVLMATFLLGIPGFLLKINPILNDSDILNNFIIMPLMLLGIMINFIAIFKSYQILKVLNEELKKNVRDLSIKFSETNGNSEKGKISEIESYKRTALAIERFSVIFLGFYVFGYLDSLADTLTLWGVLSWAVNLCAIFATYLGFIKPLKNK